MSRRRLSGKLLPALCGLIVLLAASSASGALVIVNNIVLHADGGFHPRTLPRKGYAAIDFRGYFDIAAKVGARPPALTQAKIDFDRDGRLDVNGLPTCAPDRVAAASTSEARQACGAALVGEGKVEAVVELADGPVPVSSPLILFNGPRQGGNPTVILHARTPAPAAQTFAIVAPIERRPGPFRYRVTLDFPQIASGLASITYVEAEVGRRYKAGGVKRSYVSARCRDGVLDTHGRFTFEEGTVIDGSVEKACTVVR
ncbi:MAG TPA: hypothetical protein VFX85_12230 [Solirubrobacterales bacterium]|nr:hypothetical protein [Solirubrobacterales bacterium]